MAPNLIDPGAQIAVLVSLTCASIPIGRLLDGGSGERAAPIGPLVLFALAFTTILLIRAVPLYVGEEGRFFSYDRHAEETRAVKPLLPQSASEAPILTNYVPNPSIEDNRVVWHISVSRTGQSSPAEATVMAQARRVVSDASVGDASLEATYQDRTGGNYVALELGDHLRGAPVFARQKLAVSAAVKPLPSFERSSRLQLYIQYYSVAGRLVSSELADGPRAELGVADSRTTQWTRLYGIGIAPDSAAVAVPAIVVRTRPGQPTSGAIRIDAALATPGISSSAQPLPYFDEDGGGSPIWHDGFGTSLAISIALLAAIFAGCLLPLGTRLAHRTPKLAFPSLNARRPRTILWAITIVGVGAYAIEMWTYGGYGGYLDSLKSIGQAGLSRWYLHALATLPTGAAALLTARRIRIGVREPWPAVEALTVIAGTAIGLSYWLKATVAIPALIVLLFCFFLMPRRGAVALGAAAALFAVMTPFVYLVRGSGGVRFSALLAGDYWREFWANLSSRFFHFESLMIVSPYGSSDDPWRPIVDFALTIVPRAFWEQKPLSPAARFTNDYLLSGLHSTTDVGVISLPGELWLIGGAAAILCGGLLIGVLVRTAHELIVARPRADGTMMLGVALLAGLIFLNDGWGMATVVITMIITCAGGVLIIQRHRDA
ncbi:MAG: hypothetical protein WAP35_06795 [Solirubrobacterales bacterium]